LAFPLRNTSLAERASLLAKRASKFLIAEKADSLAERA
jgi:hypothetical protein